MPKESAATPAVATYAEVVGKLDDVVKRLEGGDLSLEESLKAFEEGIRLVKRGEALLAAAEKRIDELLEEDGELKEVPLDPAADPRPPSRAPPQLAPKDDEDVPF
ncbi:MAG TPA: exodeoxyribonuclease VII small subunit [Myxococcaceae bacterium]|nr:exodeoxyribonuclease VII small subunit [Myxococcaceae bacterium]